MDAALEVDQASAMPLAPHGGREHGFSHAPEVGFAPLDPQAVERLARQVRSGTYRPRVDEVAELLVAWLFYEVSARDH